MDGVRNMSKYDKMIEVNRKASEEKVSRARAAILEMLADQSSGLDEKNGFIQRVLL